MANTGFRFMIVGTIAILLSFMLLSIPSMKYYVTDVIGSSGSTDNSTDIIVVESSNETKPSSSGNIIYGPPILSFEPVRPDQFSTNSNPKPTGNNTNGTALGTEGPRQIITGRPAMGQPVPQNQPGQSIPSATSGNIIIPNINITKEQAVKAEQEANVMIKAYYEKLEQEKQKEKEEVAALAAAAAAQSNQTAEAEAEAEDTIDETETDTEEEEEEELGQENEEENDNENGDNEGEDDE